MSVFSSHSVEKRVLARTVTLILALAFAALWSPSLAQVYSGSLTGVVTDRTGAVVPGAKAVLTDEAKGFTFTATSDSDGRYVLRNLPPGSYQLSVSAPGMRTYTRSGITLNVGQNAQADVQFEVEGTTEMVSVTALAPLLQTQDASTGQLVNQRFINDLPLTSRSVFNLAQLSPGVTQSRGRLLRTQRGSYELYLEWRPQLHRRYRHGRCQPNQSGE